MITGCKVSGIKSEDILYSFLSQCVVGDGDDVIVMNRAMAEVCWFNHKVADIFSDCWFRIDNSLKVGEVIVRYE